MEKSLILKEKMENINNQLEQFLASGKTKIPNQLQLHFLKYLEKHLNSAKEYLQQYNLFLKTKIEKDAASIIFKKLTKSGLELCLISQYFFDTKFENNLQKIKNKIYIEFKKIKEELDFLEDDIINIM